MHTSSIWAARGVAAALAGLAAGHLLAAVVKPATSPVFIVGAGVIDLTPTPVKEFAVATFGTADKPLLLASVTLGTLGLAAVAGLLARRRLALGLLALTLLAVVSAAATLARPRVEMVDLLPSLATGLVAVATLIWLARTTDVAAPASEDGPSRRGLLGAGAVILAAVVVGSAGQWLATARSQIARITLPKPARPLPAQTAGLENGITGISSFVTPNSEFYRVDINLTVPSVDVDSWRLTIDGDVRNPRVLTFEELAGMNLVERDITLTCVSNEVGGRYVGAARWLGVPLSDVLQPSDPDADQILSEAVDGFTISTPLAVALDGRDAMIAIGMNGEPLPAQHGFPARLIVPGIYGYVGATKWLSKLTVTRYDRDEAYWTARGWATEAPIKIQSRIDTPAPLARVPAGLVPIGGIAWAQDRGIGEVQVRVDGGGWQRANLGPDAGVDYWRQWWWPWRATPGRHRLSVRALTLDGEVQTAARATPFPDGASGIQEISIVVE
ncbi:molybdopterin-dependent oxidoreductase [Nocardioides limicola]|uniref:molybdopterin-dependent oxidoreductase n=1 Tax=Nocardioides limicola TaxID=2803368 RepID=UPI00193B0E06|nr:molybdopterin-dependent oxidoreductase [Nocardioides sp. DJM-14]